MDEVKLTYEDGAVYKGQIVNQMKHGKGQIWFPSGDTYIGNFADDHFHGFGTFKSEEMVYEGEWQKGYCHGKGKETWYDGIIYEGDFKQGKKTGFGFHKWPNGSEYQGDWVDGIMEGNGTLQYENGDRYEGKFMAGKRHGKGTFTKKGGKTVIGFFVNDILQDNMYGRHSYGITKTQRQQ